MAAKSLLLMNWTCGREFHFTFGDVRVVNDVRKLNQRSHQR
jgi:hypothetical protein